MTETYAVDDYADIARRIAELRPTVAARFAVYYDSPDPMKFGKAGWCRFRTDERMAGLLTIEEPVTLFDTEEQATIALHSSRSWERDNVREYISVRPYPVEEE